MSYEITVKRKVFEDPEFCNDENSCCRRIDGDTPRRKSNGYKNRFYDGDRGWCNLFNSQPELKISTDREHYIKCPECKAACQ